MKKGLIADSNKIERMYNNPCDHMEYGIYVMKSLGMSNKKIQNFTNKLIEGYTKKLRERQSQLINADISEL